MSPRILTVDELSKEVGISKWCIRRWINNGEFPVVRSGRRVFVNIDVFLAFTKVGNRKEEQK